MSLDLIKQEAINLNTSPQRLRELAAINDDLARLVAANSVADSSLLGELFIKAKINKDVEMQRSLASNPNTPTKWLIGLAYLFPEEFFSNPAYDLSILQNDNFADRFGKKLLLRLICASNAPTSFLEFAAGICENNLKIVIASHQNTSRKKLLELSKSAKDIVAKLAQLRLDCSNDDITFWDQVALNKKLNLILFIPPILMFKLVQLSDISTNFLKAASQLETFPEILNIIANHPKTHKDVLDKLAKNGIPFIAEAAKLHINYAGELETGWRDLAEEKINITQLPIATYNDERIKQRLWQVGAFVASHQNISQNSLDKLIDNRNPEVRAAALANPKLDSMLREQLATLENPNLSSLDLLELANSEHTAVRAKVVRHPHVDGSILAKLAYDKLIVRLAVAKHPKTPAEILTRFTKHPDRRLPLAVAQNPGAPKNLLIQLATQPAVHGGFYFNPLNLAAVKSLLTQEPEAAIPFLDRCLKFPERPSFSRFLVLMNPRIPSSFLARYYKSWFWPERYAIAQNPNTDPDIRQQLTQDPNRIVRAAARDTSK